MFPIPTVFLAVIVVLALSVVFVSGVGFALLLNWLLRTPMRFYLLSSGIIAVISYSLVTVFLLTMLPPLRWVNEQPQDLRTALWDHLGILAAIITLVCLAGWQIIIRSHKAKVVV
jgi:magnesium-transporting ATPase (P-type)